MPTRRQALVRFYNASDQLLTIVRTNHPDRDALLLPRRNFGWSVDIARHTIEWFSGPSAAANASVRAHLTEHPAHPDETLDLTRSTRPTGPSRSRRVRRPGPVLLRLYDAAGNLLYIARTRQPAADVAALRLRTSGWPTTIDRHTTEKFPDLATCTRASRRAHHDERPLHPDPALDLSPPRVCPVFVYRLYDADDQLVYVGQSSDPERRIPEHQFRFPTVVRHTLEEWPDRITASAAERRAIAAERPVGNENTGGGKQEEQRLLRKPYNAAMDIKARFARGEITVRVMFDELLMFPDVTPRKAAHLLGFDDGPRPSPRQRRNRGGTVEEMLALNNLAPDATVHEVSQHWWEDFTRDASYG